MYFKLTYRISKFFIQSFTGGPVSDGHPCGSLANRFLILVLPYGPFSGHSRLFGSSEAAYEIKVIKTSAYSVIELRDLKSISRNHNCIEDIISYSF